MKITRSQLKSIIKEEITKVLMSESMTPEDEKFLEDNDFGDPPMGLTPAQEKAFVDALREDPEDYDEIYGRFQDYAEYNEYSDYLDED